MDQLEILKDISTKRIEKINFILKIFILENLRMRSIHSPFAPLVYIYIIKVIWRKGRVAD